MNNIPITQRLLREGRSSIPLRRAIQRYNESLDLASKVKKDKNVRFSISSHKEIAKKEEIAFKQLGRNFGGRGGRRLDELKELEKRGFF